MHERDWLAMRFEEHRSRLKSIACRMLGSAADADDAVQDVWIRLSRIDPDDVENLGSWLTTVLSRVCLNMLQKRRLRPESPGIPDSLEPARHASVPDPEYETLLSDSIGLAMMIMLDTLSPPERVAFVLHDVFDIPFTEIAPVVGRNAATARQLASRARRRIRRHASDPTTNRLRQARLVDAFLAAARHGDFDQLLATLDPDVVLRADHTTVELGAAPETRGAVAVASFCRRARGAVPAMMNGAACVVWMPGGQPRVVFSFTVAEEKVIEIELIADPGRLRELDLVVLLEVPAP